MRTAYAKMKVRGRTGGPSSPWRVFDRTGIKRLHYNSRSPSATEAQSFRKKDRTSIGENRIHLWSNGSHAAVFPVGAAPVYVPLLCFLTKSGTSVKCCCLR